MSGEVFKSLAMIPMVRRKMEAECNKVTEQIEASLPTAEGNDKVTFLLLLFEY